MSNEAGAAFLIPAAQGWNVVRLAQNNGGGWHVQSAASLAETVPLLEGSSEVVLALPMNAVLAQRLRLPTVEETEFPEMVRIQIEKTLPYSTEEVTTDFELIEQTEEGSVISAVAVHNEKLSELAAPLLERGIIPTQVTVYAAQRAATHAAAGRAFLLYPEADALVCAITEEGKIGFTGSLESNDPVLVQRDLPQLALSAELQGIDTAIPTVLLDESLDGLQQTLEAMFVSRADLIGVEAPPAATKFNLLPASWKQQREDLARRAQWKQRLILAGGVYAALLLLFALYVLVQRVRVGILDRSIAHDEPATAFVKKTDAKWQALAPAIDPHYYPLEVIFHLFESLPSADVQITQLNQSARQVSVDGESTTAALAYQFADKVKKNPDLRSFRFEMAAPRILPNEHAQFRLEGKPK